MSEADHFRRKADKLLSEAAAADNMKERGRLIDEAMHWHALAMDATGHPDMRLHNNDDDEGGGHQSANG